MKVKMSAQEHSDQQVLCTGTDAVAVDQLVFNFDGQVGPGLVPLEVARREAGAIIEGRVGCQHKVQPLEQQESPPDEEALTEACQRMLVKVGLLGAAKLIKVRWNARLRSTAGYASFPAWRIELNPRLRDFEGQTERTLKHELAHLIAYHRAGRRRIEPHGIEWREACAALGIPDEKACHHLPLPRSRQKRSLAYQCPSCGYVLHRVRRFRRPTACLSCCNRLASGRYDARFGFVLLSEAVEAD